MNAAGEAPRGFSDPRILGAFLLITLIWGSTWIVIKDQLGTVPPTWSVTYRYVFAIAAMFGYASWARQRLSLPVSGHLLAAAIGFPQFFLNFNFVYAAEFHITSGLVATMFALLMVPNTVLAWFFFRQRVGLGFAAGSALAIAGVVLLFVQELRSSAAEPSEVLLGIALTMGGVLAASASNVMQISRAVRSHPVPVLLSWAMLYGTLFNAGFALATQGPPVVEARAGYWLGLIYLGVFASALAFTLYFRIIREVGPGRAAYSSVLVPIIAMAISTVAEGYRWSPLAICGGLLALAGLVLALRSRSA